MLALFDLDGFKQYNDSFGHPAGDALLVRLAERLKAATEGLGSVYRMGGDEFCLLASAALGEGDDLVLRPRRRSAIRPRLRDRLLARPRAHPGRGRYAGGGPAARRPAHVQHKAGRPRSAVKAPTSCCRSSPSAGRASATTSTASPGSPRHAALSGSPARGQAHPAGRRAARRRQDRDPRHRPRQAEALSDEEWEFMRRHTVIGERIVRALRRWRTRPSSSATATSASTAPATPTP